MKQGSYSGLLGQWTIAATFVALHPQCAESLTLVTSAGWPKLSDVSWLKRIIVHEG